MSDFLGIEIRGIDAVIARLRVSPDRIAEAVATETATLESAVKDRIAALFRNPARMQESIASDVTATTENARGTVTAAGLPYLGIQEFGGTTRPHDIFPVTAKALALAGSGVGPTSAIVRHVHHPGSRIPERSFLRQALAERHDAIRAALRTAVLEALGA